MKWRILHYRLYGTWDREMARFSACAGICLHVFCIHSRLSYGAFVVRNLQGRVRLTHCGSGLPVVPRLGQPRPCLTNQRPTSAMTTTCALIVNGRRSLTVSVQCLRRGRQLSRQVRSYPPSSSENERHSLGLLLPSLLRHCRLGHLTRKNPSPI